MLGYSRPPRYAFSVRQDAARLLSNCILLFSFFAMSACDSQKEKQESTDSSAAIITDTIPRPAIDTVTASFLETESASFEFVNDDVGGHPFEGELESILGSLGEYEVFPQTVRNLHDSTKTDTLFKFASGRSSIEYYKGQTGGFIITANIETEGVAFKKGIHIGMSDNDFNGLFDELRDQGAYDRVTITTLEGLAYAEFVFSNRKLAVVKYTAYFD